ncbi:hypothetical protein Hanom_Chr04g00285221 [Helianthus anomalus]
MRNNVTNVVEFANSVSEESLKMMQYLHADFNGTIKTIMQFEWWKHYHQMPIYMLCG